MLRQCLEHSYFRGNACLECEQKGRFLMNDNELNGLGRMLAGLLRHFPEKFNLEMDEHGWIIISDLINAIRNRSSQYHWFRPHHLIAIVETDPKGRYQIRDNLIRATYGHSIDLDVDLPTENIPDKLYYPTTQEEVELLIETGLKPSDRKRVHLSLTYEAAENAGKVRVPNPLILEIDARASIEAGNVIAQAGTTVFTTAEILPEFLSLKDSNPGAIAPMNVNTMIEKAPEPVKDPELEIEKESKPKKKTTKKSSKTEKADKETKKKSTTKTKSTTKKATPKTKSTTKKATPKTKSTSKKATTKTKTTSKKK